RVSPCRLLVVVDGVLDDEGRLKRCFGYLQWTREGLRQFAMPIVFWVPSRLREKMVRGAPDFWSWRDGVFAFESETVVLGQSGIVNGEGNKVTGDKFITPPGDLSVGVKFSVEELRASLKEAIAQFGEQSKPVADLYRQLGKRYEAYQTRAGYGQAIDYFDRALNCYRQLDRKSGMGRVLLDLGNTFYRLSQNREAIDFYEQSLGIKREIGDRNGEANSLIGLGLAWAKLNKKREAKENLTAARDLFAKLGLDHMVAQAENCLEQVL
ncbi:MAG: tetratricopeptide repeat protein, partial [Cyanophyceae cyanobacterium]